MMFMLPSQSEITSETKFSCEKHCIPLEIIIRKQSKAFFIASECTNILNDLKKIKHKWNYK